MKLTSGEIIKLLDNLIGPTEPYGDSAIDLARKENLNVLLNVTDWCLDGILYALQGLSSERASEKKLGIIAENAFKDYEQWIKERLNEYSVG